MRLGGRQDKQEDQGQVPKVMLMTEVLLVVLEAFLISGGKMEQFNSSTMTNRSPPGIRDESTQWYQEIKGMNRLREAGLKEVRSRARRVTKKMIEEKNPEACALPLERQRLEARCGVCAGCVRMKSEKGCHFCNGCKTKKGCIHLSRQCSQWPLKPTLRASSTSSIGSRDLGDLGDETSLLKEAITKVGAITEDLVEKINEMPRGHPIHNTSLCKKAVQEQTEGELEAANEAVCMAEGWQEEINRLQEVEGFEDLDDISSHTGDRLLAQAIGEGIPFIAQPGHNSSMLHSIGGDQNNMEVLSRGATTNPTERANLPVLLEDVENLSPRLQPREERRVEAPERHDARRDIPRGRSNSLNAMSVIREIPRRPQPDRSQSYTPGRDHGAILWGMAQGAEVRRGEYEEEIQRWERFVNRRADANAISTRDIERADKGLQAVREGLRNLSFQEEEIAGHYLEIMGEGPAMNHLNTWKEWYMRMRGRISATRDKLESPDFMVPPTPPSRRPEAPRSTPVRRGQLERVKLPSFSGKIEDWPDFRATFKELVGAEGYEPIIELTQLRSRLPHKVAELLQGIRDPVLAWERLDEKFGDQSQVIIATMNKLHSTQLPKGSQAVQVEALATAIQRARTILASIGAERDLFSDLATLGVLILKLPQVVQDRWLLRKDDMQPTLDRYEEGNEFLKWLERERKAAVASQLLALRAESKKNGGGGPNLNQGGQRQSDTTEAHANLVTGNEEREQVVTPPVGGGRTGSQGNTGARRGPTTEAEVADWKAKALTASGKCPLCNQAHSYPRKFPGTQLATQQWPSSRLASCPKFKASSVADRARAVEAQSACALCTSWLHKDEKCRMRGKESSKCRIKQGEVACMGDHHEDLHGSKSSYCHTNLTAGSGSSKDMGDGPGLFEVQQVKVSGSKESDQSCQATVFMDPGSDTNLISERLAAKLKLPGTKVTYYMRVVDTDYREHISTKHEVYLHDREGQTHQVTVLAIPTITSLPEPPDTSRLEHLVKNYPPEVLSIVGGEVDILIGLKSRRLHATCEEEIGDLRISRSIFGCGWVLSGTHPELESQPLVRSIASQGLAHATTSLPGGHHVFHARLHTGPELAFHEIEELGCAPPPICKSCQGCNDCTFRRKRLTKEETEVVARVEREMVVDETSGCITAKYPWKPSVKRMSSNLGQVRKIQEATERRMIKEGTYQGFQEEMRKAKGEGKFREITEEEQTAWHGAVHYITVFPVIKPGSLSTKTRVVSNAALKNSRSGLSLNDCVWPGPNALADLLDVLLHWRSVKVAAVLDLKKAYQAIHTGEQELHLRRFLWREDPSQPWTTYGYTCATFGDLPAGLLLEVAKRRVADLGQELDPKAAYQIKHCAYVDDVVVGGELQDVLRMKGLEENGELTGTVPRILALGGMKIKFMAVAGDSDPEEAIPLGGKVLGVPYLLAEDKIEYGIFPTISIGHSKDKQSRIMSLGEVCQLQEGTLGFTRRMALSLIMSCYDPMGLVSPALVEGKLLLRRLYGGSMKKGWDEQMPETEKALWGRWARKLLEDSLVYFPRSTKPTDAKGRPGLAGFADASLDAYCAVVYVIWDKEDGSKSSRILLAKCRVAPLHGTTIPRAELQALIVLLRLLKAAASAVAEPPKWIAAFTDSECAVAALEKSGASLLPFFANRVAEGNILLKELAELTSTLHPVYHVPGFLNPADMGTRGQVRLEDLNMGSLWQSGPQFIVEGEESWPVGIARKSAVPIEECSAKYVFVMETREKRRKSGKPSPEMPHVAGGALQVDHQPDYLIKMWKMLKLQARCKGPLGSAIRSMVRRGLQGEKLERLTRVTARALRGVLLGKAPGPGDPDPTPEEWAATREIQYIVSAPSAVSAWKAGKTLSLGGQIEGGEIWVQARVHQAKLAELLGIHRIRVLCPEEVMAERLIAQAHEEDHRLSYRDVVARTRSHAWILQATRVAKKVIERCPSCKLRSRKEAKQIMGMLPSEKLARTAPFVSVCLDMFGPFKVKDAAHGRRVFKCWGAAYSCLTTKACCLLACPGYDARTFLTTHLQFTSVYGRPAVLYTDHAPSLLRAKEDLDWEQVAKEVNQEGTTWRFSPKGCSWRNGQAERVIRMARHSLSLVLEKGVLLDLHQFSAVLLKVAAIINSRPLSAKAGVEGDYHAISASDILLGRAGRKRLQAPTEDVDTDTPEDVAVKRALLHQEHVGEEFWRLWVSQCFSEMVPRTRWKVASRDVQVGDLGHLKFDSKVSRPEWRLCRVDQTFPGQDGHVRTIEVSFRPRHTTEKVLPYCHKKSNKITVGVQRFALLCPIEEQP